MLLKDVMTQRITCLKLHAKVEKAAQLMRDLDVGSLPVCDDNHMLVGLVTDRDIVLRSVAKREDPRIQPVQEIMTVNPVVGDPDMNVDEAVRIMSENQIRRLPVVEDGQLVGFVALGDLAVTPDLKDEAGEVLSEVSEPTFRS